MEIKSDIEIAQSCEMKNIREIAATAGVDEKYLEMYGNYKAKVDYKLLNETQAQEIIDHFVMKLRMVKFARIQSYNELFSGDPVWALSLIHI